MTITAIFTLAGLLILMVMVAIEDARIALLKAMRETDEAFGHDTKIYPDNQP